MSATMFSDLEVHIHVDTFPILDQIPVPHRHSASTPLQLIPWAIKLKLFPVTIIYENYVII